MFHYSTHLPVLLACLEHAKGNILEFGSGWYSTPMIHAYSIGSGRYARSLEYKSAWYEQLKPHFHDGQNHDYRLVTEGLGQFNDVRWGVCLIDNEIPDRLPALMAVRNFANYILIHDTETSAYGIQDAIDTFPYKYRYDKLVPNTTVVSDYFPLHWLTEKFS